MHREGISVLAPRHGADVQAQSENESSNLEPEHAHKPQPIRSVRPDVFHNVAVLHPLRHRCKIMLTEAIQHTNKLQDVGM